MEKQKISIFCQASGDVIHTLALYQKYKDTSDISIYCVNVKPIYEYIQSLNLELTQLEFIPYDINVSIKRPLSIIKGKRELNKRYLQLFKNKTDETIYFFAIWFDWISFYFLSLLNKTNRLIYYKHYLAVPEEGQTVYSIKKKVDLFYYYLLTNLHLQYTDEETEKRLLFPYKKIGIESQKALKIEQRFFSHYLYRVKNINKKSILFFESDLVNCQFFTNYKSEITEILTALQQKGYSIFIKGHPNLGATKEIKVICDFNIPKEIPAELIDVKQFNCIIGIQSLSMAYFAKAGYLVYSLIDLIDFAKNSDKEMYRNYLNENSNYKINFPSQISEICS